MAVSRSKRWSRHELNGVRGAPAARGAVAGARSGTRDPAPAAGRLRPQGDRGADVPAVRLGGDVLAPQPARVGADAGEPRLPDGAPRPALDRQQRRPAVRSRPARRLDRCGRRSGRVAAGAHRRGAHRGDRHRPRWDARGARLVRGGGDRRPRAVGRARQGPAAGTRDAGLRGGRRGAPARGLKARDARPRRLGADRISAELRDGARALGARADLADAARRAG